MVNLVDKLGGALRVVETFPHRHTNEEIRIPLADGVELSAHLWMPLGAQRKAVPAIIEYIPYRHRDYTALRDALVHPWFAGHGFAALRVDMRGSGDSDGVPMDEYVAQEQQDALEVIEYVAAEDWCSGAVGMMGISWGGFNALQVAARRPPALKAIVTVCSTDDRYTDDVHYPGGCLVSDNLTWGALGFANMLRAPDPASVGERWRALWRERFEHAPFPLAQWLSHQRRDAYWEHGSVCENYHAIECAVLAVGGWADSYSNAIPRLMEGLRAPRRALIGPWVHAYPHLAVPSPRMDFLGLATRWWDRWLKDERNGVDTEPRYTTFVQDPERPAPSYEHRTGHWVQHEHWPPPGSRDLTLYPFEGRLERTPHGATFPRVSSLLGSGATAGEWMPLGAGPEMPLEQGLEDAGALSFETAPLEDDILLFGAPLVALRFSADVPEAAVFVRLSDVYPDGVATRVTFGALNLTHRDGHRQPSALQPGEPYTTRVVMNDIAQRIPAGHRLRLSLSTSCWPMFWPSPRPSTLTLDSAHTSLVLPVCQPAPDRAEPPAPAAVPASPTVSWLRPVTHRRSIEVDRCGQLNELTYHRDEGAFRVESHAMVVDSRGTERHWVVEGDPASAGGEVRWRLSLARGDWQTEVRVRVVQTCTTDHFLLSLEAEAYEGRHRAFVRSEHKRIRRDLL